MSQDPRIEAAALEDATDVVWSRSMGEIGVCCHDRERDDYKDAEEIAKEAITAYLAAADNAATITTVEELGRDLAAVTVSRDGWQTRAEAAEREASEWERSFNAERADKYMADDAAKAWRLAAEAAEKKVAAVREDIDAAIADAPPANYEEDNYDAGFVHGLVAARDIIGTEKGDNTVTMTCNYCGVEVTGSVHEVLAWDKTHRDHCAAQETP